MIGPETERFSSVRAVREIRPTAELEKFIGRVTKVGIDTFGYKDWTLVKDSHDPSGETYRGVGIPALHVYPANDLRLNLFEHRTTLPAQSRHYVRLNDRMTRVDWHMYWERLSQVHDVGQSTLRVLSSNVGVSTRPEYARRGQEYGLVLDPSPAASFIEGQASIILSEVRRTGIGNELCAKKSDFDLSLPDRVPIFRLPPQTPPQQELAFVQSVEELAEDSRLAELFVEPLQWEIKQR